MMVGNMADAREAFERHLEAYPRMLAGGGLHGEFKNWTWHFGKSRIAWLPRDGSAVYKVERETGAGANETEHRAAVKLTSEGKLWAPQTRLYRVHADRASVVAMTYYPVAIESPDERPNDALNTREVSDLHVSNFRRTAPLPHGIVKVIDLGG